MLCYRRSYKISVPVKPVDEATETARKEVAAKLAKNREVRWTEIVFCGTTLNYGQGQIF